MADSRDVNWRQKALVWGVWLTGSVSGCVAIRPPRTPSAALSDYAEALASGDAAGAYALLSPQDRRALSEAEFARLLRASQREARELAGRIESAPKARIVAFVELDDGSEIVLEREQDGFRLRDPLSRFYGQATPRAALWSFVRAVERERWDVVLALMPDAERADLTAEQLGEDLKARREELTRMVALLASARDNPIEVVGDRATMPYAESYTARFVREAGRWKIEDPE